MELKLEGSAEQALEQIRSKDNSLPFAMDDRKVFLIGMNFISENHNMERWLMEETTTHPITKTCK